MDIHCVTRRSKFDTDWEGVSLKSLIDGGFIKPTSSANFLMQHCEYGFTVNLPLEGEPDFQFDRLGAHLEYRVGKKIDGA